jgi:SET domain-containing protein
MWYISKSHIDGVGLFAAVNVFPGDTLGVAIDGRTITPMGSKINHSWSPNCRIRAVGHQWILYVVRPVPQGTEFTVDYRDTPDFIKKPMVHWT